MHKAHLSSVAHVKRWATAVARHPYWLGVALAIVTFGALLAVVIRSLPSLLTLSANDKSALPALVAATTLIGVLVTTAVTLIGVILKQSIDARTANIAQRAADDARTDQRRLTMETALQTVALLDDPGTKPSFLKASAALIVLGRLGEVDLALNLAQELWPLKRISSTAAVQLIELGLESPEAEDRYAAVLLLRNNADQLDIRPNQWTWPRSLYQWPTHDDLPAPVRRLLLLALEKWIDQRPLALEDWRGELLRAARSSDPDEAIREAAGRLGGDHL